MNGITDAFAGVSNFKDPFLKDCVDYVEIEIRKPTSYRIHPIIATIVFCNGATSGRHKIEGDNLTNVVKQIELFIDSLEKEATP